MNEVTPQQIRDAILEGLKDVQRHFARNKRATDGTIRAAIIIAAQARRRRQAAAIRRARREKTR
jgi:hypothetical protein